MSRAVIDQPGVRICALGIILSLFLGLAIQNQISGNKVNFYLTKAVQRLEPEFKIDFESARVNLSKWGLPFPVLELKNLRVSPQKNKCKNSQIFIDELEIPISFRLILGISDRIPKIRMKNFEIRLDSEDRCFSRHTTFDVERMIASSKTFSGEPIVDDEHNKTKQNPSESRSVSNVFESRTRAELREIYIEKIKFILSGMPEQPIVLRQVNFDLNYLNSKLASVSVKSKLNAIKDMRSDLFYINSDLNILMKPTELSEVDVVLNVDGKFLDGDIRFFAHYVSSNPKISYESNFNKVSTKALFPVIGAEFKRGGSFIQKVPMSVSFQNTGEISTVGANHIESTFSRILFNIDSATVSSDEIQLNFHDGNLSIRPFMVKIDSFPLSRLKNTDIISGGLDSFESLGALSGNLYFKNEKNINFEGILRDLEIVFSNRGRRDFQKIDEMKLVMRRNDNHLLLNAHSILLNKNKVNGNITAHYSLENSDTEVNMLLDRVLLNRRIWEQFTYFEQEPSLDINWSYRKNLQSEFHDLRMSADNIEFSGVLFSNLNFDVKQSISKDNENSNLSVLIRSNKVMTNHKFIENAFVSKVLISSVGLKNQKFISDKFSISLSGFNWLNLDFTLDANLYEVQSTQSMRVNIKGSSNQKSGFNSKLLVGYKNRDYRFNLYNLNGNQISIEPSN
jgi:hypothetical protein